MQDKSGLIQEPSVTNPDFGTSLIHNKHETVNLLSRTQFFATNILPSQMTKSQATMVNEATCSTTIIDNINSNTNTNLNNMSNQSNDQNQVSSRHQMQNSHGTGTINIPSPTTSATTTTTNTNTTATTINNSARTPKRTANDYRFGKTIGEGSFSSVYIAQDIHTKKEVASKLIPSVSNRFSYFILYSSSSLIYIYRMFLSLLIPFHIIF